MERRGLGVVRHFDSLCRGICFDMAERTVGRLGGIGLVWRIGSSNSGSVPRYLVM